VGEISSKGDVLRGCTKWLSTLMFSNGDFYDKSRDIAM
jgi:hypothetical protein